MIKIIISGPGATFGSITKRIQMMFEELEADVTLKLDHESAILEDLDHKIAKNQLKQEIVIETKSLPWGG